MLDRNHWTARFRQLRGKGDAGRADPPRVDEAAPVVEEPSPPAFVPRSDDAGFRGRFLTVPHIVSEWVRPHRSLRGASILDFGCGEGVSALGFALNHSAGRVVGVDIMPDPHRCLDVARTHLGIEALPPNLSLHQVRPGHLHDAHEGFDLAYSWSVFEHVDQRLVADCLRLIASALRPGGLLLLQVAPLYYSAEGSHLHDVIPRPWAHLSTQQDFYRGELAVAVPDVARREALWSMYETLNRVTVPQLHRAVSASGFEILRAYTTREGPEPPAELLEVFSEEVLRTNQVVLLARLPR